MGTSSSSIQSVKRALQILSLINTNGNMSVSELSNALNLERSTVSRLLSTMRDEGFLYQNPLNKRYSDSFKLVAMSYNILRRYPYMLDLSMKCKESITLSVIDKTDLIHIIIVEKIENPHSMKIDFSAGNRAHSHRTAMGKAMLSLLPKETIIHFYEKQKFIRTASKTVKNLDDLLKELEITREKGYGEENGEYIEGLHSIAAPISINNYPVLASLGISFPKSKYHTPQEIQYLIDMLKIACTAISAEMAESHNTYSPCHAIFTQKDDKETHN